MEGSFRFLARVWRILDKFEDVVKGAPSAYDPETLTKDEKELRRVLHSTIKKVTEDVRDRFMFNTAISSLMELVNAFYAFVGKEVNPGLVRELASALIRMLAPFTPHIAEELWHNLGGEGSVHAQQWPGYDESALVQDEVEIVLQVNGKLRGRVTVPAGLDKEEMEKAALALPKAQEHTAGKEILKVICVPGKLVNIVVKG